MNMSRWLVRKVFLSNICRPPSSSGCGAWAPATLAFAAAPLLLLFSSWRGGGRGVEEPGWDLCGTALPRRSGPGLTSPPPEAARGSRCVCARSRGCLGSGLCKRSRGFSACRSEVAVAGITVVAPPRFASGMPLALPHLAAGEGAVAGLGAPLFRACAARLPPASDAAKPSAPLPPPETRGGRRGAWYFEGCVEGFFHTKGSASEEASSSEQPRNPEIQPSFRSPLSSSPDDSSSAPLSKAACCHRGSSGCCSGSLE
mmetsp:Transcript_173137/g.555183  ORF Transcript_173137/g.555183 Transcript_173137/m.555183 type:complete len:257 (+) Transcript_173137:1913-2683(+)